MSTGPHKPLSADERENLENLLKRCTPETLAAAIAFREDGDVAQVPSIIIGVTEKYVEPEVRPRLHSGNSDLRILEDLGVDSLTMMDLILVIEEVLDISIDNEELSDLRTIGDVQTFMDCKVRGLPLPEKARHLDGTDIMDLMPHGDPFLFLQSAAIRSQEARGTYQISGEEAFLQGHFKDNPVFPASIMLEALGQLGVLYLMTAKHEALSEAVDPGKIFFTAANGLRCTRICKPGEQLIMSLKPKRIRRPLAVFEGTLTVDNEKAAFAEEISLTFDFKGEDSPTTDSEPQS